ncbi:MAG: sterol desaturase family protein [Planctomycetales bacterium]|nr:sterol desaturase family protein [Planctomycetales bacterium]
MPSAREFRFGEGRISAVLGLFLGSLGFGGVLCLLFPSLLSTPDMRVHYPMGLLRGLILATLAGGFGFGVLSLLLRRGPTVGLAGMALSIAGTLLGGAGARPAAPSGEAPVYLGLDWFLLSLFLLALVFVPLERIFGRLRDQRIFREGWTTDLAHFAASHLLVQVSVLLTMLPAAVFFGWIVLPGVQAAVSSQPVALQFVEVVVLADLTGYLVHRLFHAVPFLWRIHQVHHSSRVLDRLAASRLHLFDILVMRAAVFVPLYVLGFSSGAIYGYLVLVSFHAILIHANLRFDSGWLSRLVATPRFHHWHHSSQRVAWDKNFAIHFPWIDRLFGTLHLPPGEWPSAYGIQGDPVPEGYGPQLGYPFRSVAR